MNRFAAIAVPFIAAVAPLAACAQDNLLAAYGAEGVQPAPTVAVAVSASEAASKFYLHPAMLYLAAEAPRAMHEHPAVVVARRARMEAEATAIARAPARDDALIVKVQPTFVSQR